MRREPESPFRIVVLGDFSGRENQGLCGDSSDIANRKALRVDRDNFSDVLQRLNVRLPNVMNTEDDTPIHLRFSTLDDFHPDCLYERVELFSELRSLRDKLLDDRTFDEAAAEVRSWGVLGEESPAAPAEAGTAPEARDSADSASDVLKLVLDVSERSPTVDPTQLEWSKFIRNIAAPYSTLGSQPRQAELVACVDTATQATMSALLHHPDFQKMEAAWRSLHLLVNRLETSPYLKIYLIDVSKRELSEDLLSVEDLVDSGLYRLLVDETIGVPGSEMWTLIVGNYDFGTSQSETDLLGRLAEIVKASQAGFASSIAPSASVEGETEPDHSIRGLEQDANWESVRNSSASATVAMAWPRFLLRLPYGCTTKPIDSFAYEETFGWSKTPPLLWGNSAFLCALAMGESFSRIGWAVDASERFEFDDLPLWISERDGETHIHPCGEFLLSDRQSSKLRSLGITPLVSIRDQALARIDGVDSIAGGPWEGPWGA